VLEVVRSPVAYFFAMIVVFSAASLPPSPPTLMAAKSNPAWLLALLGGAAAMVAAVVDYYLVRRVFRLGALERARRHVLFARAERWARVAPFLTIVAFAVLPLPFMIPRVLMPVTGYPLRRYAAAVGVGRFQRVFVLATFGQIFDVPGWVLEVLFAGGVVMAIGSALLRGGRGSDPGVAPREPDVAASPEAPAVEKPAAHASPSSVP
jgi:uncharacterized membrane protein YdjX (TVP38/TMEM64 family)